MPPIFFAGSDFDDHLFNLNKFAENNVHVKIEPSPMSNFMDSSISKGVTPPLSQFIGLPAQMSSPEVGPFLRISNGH